ncbi:unnamed protein product [Arabis nemorensis]|uniref:Exocyst subunit Exo70 family protein n=1 Tax=Arabis nemorensis TaxID=586526 RepID=A0A565BV27_9BRAS|nr:unnamed protein product [Arabis nemorensis]
MVNPRLALQNRRQISSLQRFSSLVSLPSKQSLIHRDQGRTSNLRVVMGDYWVTNHEVKVTQYLEKYEKMAWGDVITSLPGDSTAEAKAEESLRRFKEAFEEAYKKHKNWVVPDPKLKDEIKFQNRRKNAIWEDDSGLDAFVVIAIRGKEDFCYIFI